MQQVVYEDEFIIISIDKEKKIYIEDWKPVQKDGEKWKELHQIGFDLIKKYKPKIYLSFTENSIFSPTEELNQWFIQEIDKQGINKIIEKGAIVVPKDFIVGLGLEILAQKIIEVLKIPVLFFTSREKAIKWTEKFVGKRTELGK